MCFRVPSVQRFQCLWAGIGMGLSGPLWRARTNVAIAGWCLLIHAGGGSCARCTCSGLTRLPPSSLSSTLFLSLSQGLWWEEASSSSSSPLHDLHTRRLLQSWTHPPFPSTLSLLYRLCDTMHHGPSPPGSGLLTGGASVTLLSKALLQARPSWPHKRYPKAKKKSKYLNFLTNADTKDISLSFCLSLSLCPVCLCRPSWPAACVLRDKTQLWLLVLSLSNSKA